MGSTLLELHEQEMGFLQGSVLSPALFTININNVVRAVLRAQDAPCFEDVPTN